MYDIPTVVFRMSCIAGERQFGNEDEGWVADFLYTGMVGKPIVIYGDGRQVRDVLHVQDLLKAFEAVRGKIQVTRGQVYNVGGGVANTISLLELIEEIDKLTPRNVEYLHEQPRPGDQLVYVTDCSKLQTDTGWHPVTSVRQILEGIYHFRKQNPHYFPTVEEPVAGSLVVGALPLQRTA